jgi:hypothetical protein
MTTQHYPRDTIEVSGYCNKCGKMTPRTVSDRRLGYCIPCYDKPLPEAKPPKEPSAQLTLEEVYGSIKI